MRPDRVSDRPWSASDLSLRLIEQQPSPNPTFIHKASYDSFVQQLLSLPEKEGERELNKDFSNSIAETNKNFCYKAVECEKVTAWTVIISQLKLDRTRLRNKYMWTVLFFTVIICSNLTKQVSGNKDVKLAINRH